MSYLKKAWLTEQGNLFSITLESNQPETDYTRIKTRVISFPEHPTPEHPLRHSVILSLFTQEDINKLGQVLDQYRTDK